MVCYSDCLKISQLHSVLRFSSSLSDPLSECVSTRGFGVYSSIVVDEGGITRLSLLQSADIHLCFALARIIFFRSVSVNLDGRCVCACTSFMQFNVPSIMVLLRGQTSRWKVSF